MLKISTISNRKVLLPKKPKAGKDGTPVERWSKLGRVHMAVFTPDGMRVVGVLVRRPDVAGMVKRDDAFVAWDSFELREKELVVTRPDDGMDDAARKRLNVEWDKCILWAGMDVKTVDGKPLGYVSDAEYDEKTGRTLRFFSSDGGVANALVGSFSIEPSMVRGYSKGCMIVDPGDAELLPEGGFAAKAGEATARAKVGASEAGKKAGEAAGKAVDKGSFELGKLIGKAQRAIADATAEEPEEQAAPAVAAIEAADVQVSAPVETLPAAESERAQAPEPKTYAPTAKPQASVAKAASKPAAKPAAKKPTADQAARAVGKQLGSFGKMFGGFADEFKKASK